MKVFCEFLKMYKGNTIGDCVPIEYEDYIELEKKGIVRQKNILCKEEIKEEITFRNFKDRNILGNKYRKNRVDIVVLTKDSLLPSFPVKPL